MERDAFFDTATSGRSEVHPDQQLRKTPESPPHRKSEGIPKPQAAQGVAGKPGTNTLSTVNNSSDTL